MTSFWDSVRTVAVDPVNVVLSVGCGVGWALAIGFSAMWLMEVRRRFAVQAQLFLAQDELADRPVLTSEPPKARSAAVPRDPIPARATYTKTLPPPPPTLPALTTISPGQPRSRREIE